MQYGRFWSVVNFNIGTSGPGLYTPVMFFLLVVTFRVCIDGKAFLLVSTLEQIKSPMFWKPLNYSWALSSMSRAFTWKSRRFYKGAVKSDEVDWFWTWTTIQKCSNHGYIYILYIEHNKQKFYPDICRYCRYRRYCRYCRYILVSACVERWSRRWMMSKDQGSIPELISHCTMCSVSRVSPPGATRGQMDSSVQPRLITITLTSPHTANNITSSLAAITISRNLKLQQISNKSMQSRVPWTGCFLMVFQRYLVKGNWFIKISKEIYCHVVCLNCFGHRLDWNIIYWSFCVLMEI